MPVPSGGTECADKKASKECPMPNKKLSLKPIVKDLKRILSELKKEAGKKRLTPKQKKTLATDIKNVQKLIKEIPPNCYLHIPRYDLGI
jgi:hypothetical protein